LLPTDIAGDGSPKLGLDVGPFTTGAANYDDPACCMLSDFGLITSAFEFFEFPPPIFY